MAHFEALYGRRCRTPLCWYESGERVILGPEIVQETTEKIRIIREKMKASQSRQKSYHDKRRKDLEFQEGDHVFLESYFDYRSRTCIKVKEVDVEIYWTISNFEESRESGVQDCFAAILGEFA
ncbi:hypothetical protein A2U01_0049246 [Trifolium medium]|uniref:Retrotransposon gag protein n=1 Tax=Trifolium medium TaxID=97028 RepID=A0A392QWZ3_9FABA|nr:hypothetical protein [Trifolium medium]